MDTPPITNLYKRHRFPAEIISHGVWLYFRFCLSYRDVEELIAAHGVILTYEAVRYSCTTTNRVKMGHLVKRDVLTNRVSSYIGALSSDK
jgi:putative transposase